MCSFLGISHASSSADIFQVGQTDKVRSSFLFIA